MDLSRELLLKKLLPAGIILTGIAVFLLMLISAPSSPRLPPKERVWLVDTVTAEPRTLSPDITLYGQIETPALLNAAAPNKSRVVTVSVKEGDTISTGQLLLTLDERDFRPKQIQAEARAEELRGLIDSEQLRYRNDLAAIKLERSILKLEQSSVNRARQLKSKKLGSTAALEEAQESLQRHQLDLTNRQLSLDEHAARLQQLQARLAFAEADVDLANLALERSRIVAPFDGYVEQLAVTAGDQVQEGQLLMTLYPANQLELRAKIPVTFQHEIQRALSKGTPLLGTADLAGATLKVKLVRISGKADSRGIDGLFQIIAGQNWARVGATVSITLRRPAQKGVIALPYSALYDNHLVYRVADQRMQAVRVKIIGDYSSDQQPRLLVKSDGLRQGDQIISTQLPEAVSGLKIETR